MWSVLDMNVAVDDTVDTMECDGDGEEDRKGEAGDGVGVPGVSQITPLGFIMSL